MADSRFFLTSAAISADEAAAFAGAQVWRRADARVARSGAPDEPDLSDAVIFIEQANDAKALAGKPVALCLTTPAIADAVQTRGAIAATAAPRLAFARLAARLHSDRRLDIGAGISPSATVAESARIHETAVIGAGADIAERCDIGANAVIGPGVVLGPDCAVGPNAVISHAIVGARCAFLAGAVIGDAGFGFVPGPEGLVRMPQLGRVLIGDDVEIGANSTIDRGALGDTEIGAGVKIDNLVQVGHNVRIGPNTVIAAQTGVSGSVTIGAGVMMGGQVGMADHLEIGDGAQLAAQSGVMRNVPPGEKWAGTPAKPAKTWFREITLLARLAATKKTDGHDSD